MNQLRMAMTLIMMAVGVACAEIQKAGDLLLSIDTSALSSLTNGETVSAWANTGTLGGSFLPTVVGQGAVYQTSVGGAPAVTFAASANSVMTNTVPPPDSILSNNIWSAEIWVLNPTLQSPEDQLSWTDRGSWVGSSEGTCMEIRYCSDVANAVEHYGSTQNIPWSGNSPLAGVWHHVAITRSADGSERLYADGVLRTTKTPPIANLRGGGRFALGGVWDRGASNWQMLFSGSLAQVRVHSGTLTDEQVLNNYQVDRASYQTIWSGTSGMALPWSDPADWEGGNVGGDGETVWIDNGGTAVLTNTVALNYLYPLSGGLTVSNGANLSLNPVDSIYMGNGNAFALTLADGRIALPGSANVNFYMGNNGGDVTVSLGGSGAPAILDVDRDTVLAYSSGSAGVMTVGTGAGIYNSNGWFYAAYGIGASAQMTVNGGLIGFRTADKNFVLNSNGARADVTVNDGLIDASGAITWSYGTSTNVAYGSLHLNGGTLHAKQFYGVTTAGTNLLYLNGGTIQARDTRTDFMYNLTAAYVQNSGAVFDVPSNVTVTAAQGLLADPASTGGGLTKTGTGRLTFSGVNTFTGGIGVQGGDLFFSNTSGLPSGYAGAVAVANEGAIGYNSTGGAVQLLSLLDTGSSGYLTLFANNAADNVDFSSLPNMKLAFQGVTNYTGTFTPYQGQYTFKIEGVNVTNAAVLADGNSMPGHLKITGVSNGGMVLIGNNTFTGGAEIDAATVSMGHANALGVQGTVGVPDVALRNGAVLRFDAAMDLNAFVTTRLTADSSGILLIGAANAAQSIDLSGHPGIVVGSGELSLDYSGTLTPSANAYQLGGGTVNYSGSYRGLSVSNLADSAGATAVVIGTPGIVELKAGNLYSGGTVVTNHGVLFIKADGLGVTPAAPDAANLTVNNGVIRSGDANFTLNANRGVSVGAGGMELHPWGGFTMTVAGNLSGSGPVNTSDSGTVTFGGTGNSYNGRVTIAASQNIRIGDGPDFSWVSTGGITDNGTLYLKADGNPTFTDTVSGSGSVRKEGSGILTLASAQNYSGKTYIDAGLLRVSATNVLPRGTGKGVVEIASGAALDANGGDLLVGGLNGVGVVTNSAGGASTLYVGETNVTASFSGTVDAAIPLVKIGAGTQTLVNTNNAAYQVTVQAGALELAGAARVTGPVSVGAGATLRVFAGEPGLRGEFYRLSVAPVTNDFVSQGSVDSFLSGKTVNLVTNSSYLGASFDMGATGSGFTPHFPSGYNTNPDDLFVVRWAGLFYAEVTGSYGFATASDDGSMVFVDGVIACDNNAMQSYTLADASNVGHVTLTAGYHPIQIVMYENSGDQGLTVWMTPPSGSQALLPNALLFTGSGGTVGASVDSLAGVAGGVLSFGNTGSASLTVSGDGDMTFDGAIIGSNVNSRLIKQGAGTLTLSSGDSDHTGVLDIRSGSLVLTNGTALLGTLVMANGVKTVVYGQKGLTMQFFNRPSVNDAVYTSFLTLSAWKAYLSTTFSSGPSYVTNSLILGANLDTGAAGEYWPAIYKQTGGTYPDYYDTYTFGSIYLDQPGTYTFGTASDDGSSLFIDGTLVVNNGYNQGVTARYGTIVLSAGFHDIDIPYRENTGGNALRVYIAYPGGTTNLMPQAILFGGTGLRGLAGEAGSTLNLGASGAVVLNQDADTTHAGSIVGGTSSFLEKAGTGTLTLTDDNVNYTGKYAIVNGVLRVGDGGITGALGTMATVSVGAAGTLLFDRAGTVTIGGAITGSGLLELDGPGEVYLTSSANNFTGQVLVNNGRLTFAPGISLGANAAISNAATIEAETSGTSTFVGNMTGDGTLEVTGNGTLLLPNGNTFPGTTRVATGATLRVSSPSQLGDGGHVALDGGTLAMLPSVDPGTNQLVSPLMSSEWKLNGNAVWTNRYASNWIQLTANSSSQAGSAYCTNSFNVGVPWYASFRYECGDHAANAADGIAFVVQNDSRGASALGTSGGAIGVSSVTPSIGIFFNIYQTPSIGWVTNGVKVDAVSALNSVVLTNGVDVALAYDGLKLTLTITQGSLTYSAMRTVNLSTVFNGNTAYVGFSGGTGGAFAQQFVGNFALSDALPKDMTFGNSVTVLEGNTGTLSLSLVNDDATFGVRGFDLGSDATLNVAVASGSMPATDYTIAASNVTVAAGTATVNVAANGSGAGVLALNTLTIGSGAKLVVTGAVSVPGGVLTVVVPTPVPRGVTYLADFMGATWVGGLPVIVLSDSQGNIIDETVVLRNGRLYINTVKGTAIILR